MLNCYRALCNLTCVETYGGKYYENGGNYLMLKKPESTNLNFKNTQLTITSHKIKFINLYKHQSINQFNKL